MYPYNVYVRVCLTDLLVLQHNGPYAVYCDPYKHHSLELTENMKRRKGITFFKKRSVCCFCSLKQGQEENRERALLPSPAAVHAQNHQLTAPILSSSFLLYCV